MQKNIVQKWFFQQQPEIVWEFLTDPKLISQWLMENDFKPIVGHKFNFYSKPKIKFGFDGIVYCEVLEVQPYKKLAYSWKGGPGNGKITLDSIVTWTLVTRETGTELQLEHTGFKGIKNYFAYLGMNKGWGSKIKDRLEKILLTNMKVAKNV